MASQLFDLDGRVALVTGGGSGFKGLNCARLVKIDTYPFSPNKPNTPLFSANCIHLTLRYSVQDIL